MSNETLFEEIKDWVIAITIAVVLAFFIRYFIVELYKVSGPSMQPTLMGDERLVVNKFIYRFKEPTKGDVLIFQSPADPQKDYIKRVIATPGDTIEIKDGKVFVNNQLQKEDYLSSETRGSYELVTVPAGHMFVMGDNRNNSDDSRSKSVGFVPYKLIKGKAMVVFWPFNNMKAL